MPGIIGKKLGMTSVFTDDGKQVPCTIIQAGPCVITQIKTVEKDGYKALQLAYDDAKEKNTPKALLGHFKKAGTTPKRKLLELKGFVLPWKVGDVIRSTISKMIAMLTLLLYLRERVSRE